MQADEKAIIEYLKSWPQSFVSGKEIARKACGKSRFVDDPGWALPVLVQLVQHGVIETDHIGGYKLVPQKRKKNDEASKHVSPQLLKILKSSGKSFEGLSMEDETDNH